VFEQRKFSDRREACWKMRKKRKFKHCDTNNVIIKRIQYKKWRAKDWRLTFEGSGGSRKCENMRKRIRKER
jgi:hypothetical protein